MNFDWNNGPIELQHYDIVHKNVTYKPCKYNSCLVDIYSADGERITNVFRDTGNGFTGCDVGEPYWNGTKHIHVYVRNSKLDYNVVDMSDEKLAAEIRKSQMYSLHLHAELRKRGYTVYDEDGQPWLSDPAEAYEYCQADDFLKYGKIVKQIITEKVL